MDEIDNACASCGELLFNPFTGADISTFRELDMAYEAHAPECPGEFGDVEL